MRRRSAFPPRRPRVQRPMRFGPRRGLSSGLKLRLLIGLGVAGFALFSFLRSAQFNTVTGEKQYLAMTPHQEIALGLEATPSIIREHGGLHASREDQDRLDLIGQQLVRGSVAAETEWEFEFHLLADPNTVNAFALPGGQVFITWALYEQLQTEGQLAGVLGHEIGHVLGRHSAQRMAKSQFAQGILGAILVASGSAEAARVSSAISSLVNMKYGREDELESDELGVRILAENEYDPHALIGVMEILSRASGGNRQPEFMSTHPSPENRVKKIEDAIAEHVPQGVPSSWTP